MALYYEWGVKTGFTFAIQFFMLISDGWDRVKISENLGATAVAPVAPADTSLLLPKVCVL